MKFFSNMIVRSSIYIILFFLIHNSSHEQHWTLLTNGNWGKLLYTDVSFMLLSNTNRIANSFIINELKWLFIEIRKFYRSWKIQMVHTEILFMLFKRPFNRIQCIHSGDHLGSNTKVRITNTGIAFRKLNV